MRAGAVGPGPRHPDGGGVPVGQESRRHARGDRGGRRRGRTSLHRYFPDRETLINAVVRDSASAISQAMRDARLDEGDPVEAMRRLVTMLLAAGHPREGSTCETPVSPTLTVRAAALVVRVSGTSPRDASDVC
ncbi:TetR/AcrR family transcriptional regulator [Microbispora rosea]|uniref:TetR/AcrR family transcriptional regulator n=1 Tax=Microbispora rosea TaxID=58117 RepID=UPI0034461247